MAKVTDLKPAHQVFTYNVNMVVQVLSDNETDARGRLDKEGGYVSKREVTLITSAVLPNDLLK
jgi:hypothetical protein